MTRGLQLALGVGGLLLIAQIVLLSVQLGVLRGSYSHIRAQDAKASRLYPLQRSTARNALPVLRDARQVVRPLGEQTGKIVEATDVLPELVSEAVPALRGTRALVGAVLGQDLIGTIKRTAADTHESRAMLARSLAIQRQSLAAQLQTLAIQKQALALLQQSRGIQEETLQHARSLDNKTGGQTGAQLPTP
jgi:hypothetical protein